MGVSPTGGERARRARRPFAVAGTDVLALAGIGLLAFLVRGVPVLYGGGLRGLQGYDDGVYYGMAVALVEGRMPYRDILLLHPPGEPLALVPFALLGGAVGDEIAFATARLATLVLGGVNAVLAALTAGTRDRRAGIVAGLVYATWNAVANAERTTDLHALQDTFLLAALLALARRGRIRGRRAAIAGVALGLATAVQLWQGLAAVVMLGWVLARAPRRHARRARLAPAALYVAGAGAAFGGLCAPFLLAAPDVMIRQTLLDQLGRPPTGVPVIERLRAIEGLPRTSQLSPALRRLVPGWAVVAVAAAAAVLVAYAARRAPWARPWAVLAAAQAIVVLLTPSFFNDYAAFVAPAGSLVLGTAAARLLDAAPRRPGHTLVVAGIATALGVSAFLALAHPEGTSLRLAEIRSRIAGARCVSADYPSTLVLTGALRDDLRRRCPVVLDPTGIRYDADRGRLEIAPHTEQLLAAPGYQAAMRDWYGGSDAILFVRTDAGLVAATRDLLESRFPVRRHVGTVEVRTTGR